MAQQSASTLRKRSYEEASHDRAVRFEELNKDAVAVQAEPWSVPLELLKAASTGDVLLLCKDGKAVRCHSLILALSSTRLCEMLQAIGVTKGCNMDKSVELLVEEDEGLHWIYAMQYIYPPLLAPAPILSSGNAAAVALLGHKYKMPVLQRAWKQFSCACCMVDLDVGHYKWIINNWSTKSHLEGSIQSPFFQVAGQAWQLELFPKGNTVGKGTHLSLRLCSMSTQTAGHPHARFKLQLVHQLPPFDNFAAEVLECQFSDKETRFELAKFIPCSEVSNASKGFVSRADTLEVQVSIQVLPKPGATTVSSAGQVQQWQLTDDPSDAGYVCKWLQVACKVEDEQLKAACTTILAHNAFHMDNKDRQVWKDLCASITHQDMPQPLRMLFPHGN